MFENNSKNCEPDESFPPDIEQLWRNRPKAAPSSDFNTRVLARVEANRARGPLFWLSSALRAEIEGVAVWRLALSTLGGAFGTGCVLACAGALPLSDAPTVESPTPSSRVVETPFSRDSYAALAREFDLYTTQPRPLSRPSRRPQPAKTEKEVSCEPLRTRSAAHWA